MEQDGGGRRVGRDREAGDESERSSITSERLCLTVLSVVVLHCEGKEESPVQCEQLHSSFNYSHVQHRECVVHGCTFCRASDGHAACGPVQ